MKATQPDYPSFQDLLNDELVPVPDCLREDTQPAVENIALDVGRWTEQSFFDREVELLWPKVWQMVCRETALVKPGDYLVYDITRYSILLVCTDDHTIKAYHNSCLHRGRAIKSGKGRSRELRCPYHGFAWNLDGTFKEAFRYYNNLPSGKKPATFTYKGKSYANVTKDQVKKAGFKTLRAYLNAQKKKK